MKRIHQSFFLISLLILCARHQFYKETSEAGLQSVTNQWPIVKNLVWDCNCLTTDDQCESSYGSWKQPTTNQKVNATCFVQDKKSVF